MTDSDPENSTCDTEEVELQLIRQYEPMIRRAARRLKVRSCDFEDALQSGRLGVIEALRKFDATRGVTFGVFARRYVFGHIRRVVYGYSTRTITGERAIISDIGDEALQVKATQSGAEEGLISAEIRTTVRRFVKSLPLLERAAVVDRMWNDRTQAETASAHNVSQPAVHKAYKRALLKGLHELQTAA